MKKRLFWAIFAAVLFCAYGVTKIMFSDFLFTTHSARNAVVSNLVLSSPFVMTVALIGLSDKIKVRAKRLVPTIVLTFSIVSFIVVKFGIFGEISYFAPFYSSLIGIFLVFAIVVLAAGGDAFKVYFLANVILAIIGFVINGALCFSQFQPAVLGALSYGILSNILYGMSCDKEAESEEETLAKFEENVKKLCDLL